MIVGSGVILFDPIFQGLAISLMAGEVASLFLSRMTVPVLYYLSERKKHEQPSIECVDAPAETFIDVPTTEETNGHSVATPEIEIVETVVAGEQTAGAEETADSSNVEH